jgi:hypothetical protein
MNFMWVFARLSFVFEKGSLKGIDGACTGDEKVMLCK